MACIAAAKTLGREADVFVAGQGADEFAWQDIACNPQYIASTLYLPERYGKTLIPAMIDILDGKEITEDGAEGTVPKNLFTSHSLVNAGNIRDTYPEIPGLLTGPPRVAQVDARMTFALLHSSDTQVIRWR